jgi:hypothetical protein
MRLLHYKVNFAFSFDDLAEPVRCHFHFFEDLKLLSGGLFVVRER